MRQAQTSRRRIGGVKTGKGNPLLMASNYRRHDLNESDYVTASQGGGIKINDMMRTRDLIRGTT